MTSLNYLILGLDQIYQFLLRAVFFEGLFDLGQPVAHLIPVKFVLEELSIPGEIELSEVVLVYVVGEFLKDVFALFLNLFCDVGIAYLVAFDLSVFVLNKKLVTDLHQKPLLLFLILNKGGDHKFIDVGEIREGK